LFAELRVRRAVAGGGTAAAPAPPEQGGALRKTCFRVLPAPFDPLKTAIVAPLIRAILVKTGCRKVNGLKGASPRTAGLPV